MSLTIVVIASLGLLAGYGLVWARGSVIRAHFVPNHGEDFDFRDPPCAATEVTDRSNDRPWIRYLGISGIYIEWRGTAVLTPPLFSRYSLGHVVTGKLSWDQEAIRQGMQGLDVEKIRAVAVGHAHYDHFGDLPPILREFVPEAPLLVNRSGRNMIEGCEGVLNPIVDLEQQSGNWFQLTDTTGASLPVRILPLPSGHAPASNFFRFAPGQVTEPWDCMNGKEIDAMKEGNTFAFLIDLLDEQGEIAFRIHYQDAASSAPEGFPPDEVLIERDVDLAIVCLPSAWRATNYPEGLLQTTRARHVLITHYEDFFQDTGRPIRFAPLLSNRRANRFMERLAAEMKLPEHQVRAPHTMVCGPAGPAWSMPLPGEWLGF